VNYNSLLCSGYFANFDLLYVMAAPNSAAANLNLLTATFPLVPTNSPTFTARQGYTGNGTSAFLDTGWKASTNAVNYTLASVTHFGYALTNGIADTKALYGAQNVAGTSEATNYAGTGGWYSDANDFSGTTKAAVTSSNGMFLLNRTSGVLTASFNGAVVPSPVSVATVAMPDQNMRILQSNGDAGSFTTNTVAAVGFGAGGQNDAAIARQVNSFMMAYGINVY
jgi:hypothetical protein